VAHSPPAQRRSDDSDVFTSGLSVEWGDIGQGGGQHGSLCGAVDDEATELGGTAVFGQRGAPPMVIDGPGWLLQLEGVEERARAGSTWPEKGLGSAQRDSAVGGAAAPNPACDDGLWW
jgi:hypothetical protein